MGGYTIPNSRVVKTGSLGALGKEMGSSASTCEDMLGGVESRLTTKPAPHPPPQEPKGSIMVQPQPFWRVRAGWGGWAAPQQAFLPLVTMSGKAGQDERGCPPLPPPHAERTSSQLHPVTHLHREVLALPPKGHPPHPLPRFSPQVPKGHGEGPRAFHWPLLMGSALLAQAHIQPCLPTTPKGAFPAQTPVPAWG